MENPIHPNISFNRWLPHLAIALFVGIFAVAFKETDYGEKRSVGLLEQNFGLRKDRVPSADVVLVAVDDDSYKSSGEWPRDRRFDSKVLTTALLNIQKSKPRLLILDAPFPEDMRDGSENEDLWNLIYGSKNIAIWSGVSPRDSFTLSDKMANDEPSEHSQRRQKATTTLPMALRLSNGMPLIINADPPDNDGVNEAFPWIQPLTQIAGYKNIERPGERDLINYYGDRGTISTLSLTKFLKDDNLPSLEGKIVLLGFQSAFRQICPMPHTELQIPVPSKKSGMFGSEVHATIISNLLDGSWLKRPSPVYENLILFFVVFLTSLYLLVFLGTLGAIQGLITLSLASFFATYIAFLLEVYITPIFTGVLGAAVLLLVIMLIREALNLYGARKVVEGIIAQKLFSQREEKKN